MTDEPVLPYGRQWVDEDDIEAVADVLRGDWLTTGPLVAEFESALAAMSGCAHAVAVNSGTAALHVGYFAAGLSQGDVLVTSPLTFVSTANVALHLGASVRFADVEPDTGNLDPKCVEQALCDRTRLVVAVDYAGHPASYDALRAPCAKRGISLFSDGSHSLGATSQGRPVAALADATTTSFHPVKGITTAEGGALLTDRDDWRERAASFRNHGIVRDPARVAEQGPWSYEVRSLGLNYRLPDILCALGLSQLRKLDGFLARRRTIAKTYQAAFAAVPGVELPVVHAGVEPSWHLYVLRVREAARRRSFFEALRARGLGVQLHYMPVHTQPLYRALGHEPGALPRAEDFASRALSLPLYPSMSERDVERVIDIVTAVAGELL